MKQSITIHGVTIESDFSMPKNSRKYGKARQVLELLNVGDSFKVDKVYRVIKYRRYQEELGIKSLVLRWSMELTEFSEPNKPMSASAKALTFKEVSSIPLFNNIEELNAWDIAMEEEILDRYSSNHIKRNLLLKQIEYVSTEQYNLLTSHV